MKLRLDKRCTLDGEVSGIITIKLPQVLTPSSETCHRPSTPMIVSRTNTLEWWYMPSPHLRSELMRVKELKTSHYSKTESFASRKWYGPSPEGDWVCKISSKMPEVWKPKERDLWQLPPLGSPSPYRESRSILGRSPKVMGTNPPPSDRVDGFENTKTKKKKKNKYLQYQPAQTRPSSPQRNTHPIDPVFLVEYYSFIFPPSRSGHGDTLVASSLTGWGGSKM